MLKHFPCCIHRILEVICSGLRVSPDFDYDTVAAHTPGYVGADMEALKREAAICAVDRWVKTSRILVVWVKNIWR